MNPSLADVRALYWSTGHVDRATEQLLGPVLSRSSLPPESTLRSRCDLPPIDFQPHDAQVGEPEVRTYASYAPAYLHNIIGYLHGYRTECGQRFRQRLIQQCYRRCQDQRSR